MSRGSGSLLRCARPGNRDARAARRARLRSTRFLSLAMPPRAPIAVQFSAAMALENSSVSASENPRTTE